MEKTIFVVGAGKGLGNGFAEKFGSGVRRTRPSIDTKPFCRGCLGCRQPPAGF